MQSPQSGANLAEGQTKGEGDKLRGDTIICITGRWESMLCVSPQTLFTSHFF